MTAHQDRGRQQRVRMFHDETSEGPSYNANSTTYQTSMNVVYLEAEGLAVTEKWVRKVPPVSKGTHILTQDG